MAAEIYQFAKPKAPSRIQWLETTWEQHRRQNSLNTLFREMLPALTVEDVDYMHNINAVIDVENKLEAYFRTISFENNGITVTVSGYNSYMNLTEAEARCYGILIHIILKAT